MLYLHSILTPLSMGTWFRQFDPFINDCPCNILIAIRRLASRLVSHRGRITKLCHNGIVDTLNGRLEASKGDRSYARGACPLEVKVKPTYEDGRQAVFFES